jgi:hypothetical protein
MREECEKTGCVYRQAKITDAAALMSLYAEVYQGRYPDRSFSTFQNAKNLIISPEKFIFVACCEEQIVAAVVFDYDSQNYFAKESGAVVLKGYRGLNLTNTLALMGESFLRELSGEKLEVLYLTTRTVHSAAQHVASSLGFKKIGIFPNVHKTENYETHALAAKIYPSALEKRNTDFEQHPKVAPMFNIVREELGLEEMKVASYWDKKEFKGAVPHLELIDAKFFVQHRLQKLVDEKKIGLAFYPFHKETHLITSADQRIEVFLYINEMDHHSVITGLKIDREVCLTNLLLEVGNLLRDRGVRYIEMIVRAHRFNIIDKVTKAKFVPCGYFPAFQLVGETRYDYVTFSRSFEILDFTNVKLAGINQKYLLEYMRNWEEISIAPEYLVHRPQSSFLRYELPR